MKPTFTSALLSIFALCSVGSLAQTVQADSLKRILSITKIDTAKVNLYNKLADSYKESHPDSTIFYAQKANVLAVKTEYKPGLATSYINKGNAALMLGDYREALKSFRNAQAEFSSLLEKNEDNAFFKDGLARAFASSGIVYSEQGNYYMALENYHKALTLYEETRQQKNISKALNNIGIVYKSQQDYPKALDYLKRAYTIQRSLGEQNAPVTLTNIGVIYFETGKLAMSIKYFSQARELFENNNNKRGLALLENYTGDYYAKLNDPNLAAEYYNKSIALSESIKDKFGASLAYYNLGKLYSAQEKYTEALSLATKSLVYAREIGVLDQAYHSEKLVSELYSSLHDPAAALEHYKNYIIAKDSLVNQENNKKLLVAEMNFAYKKKEALLIEKGKRQTQFVVFILVGIALLIALALVLYNRMQVKRRLTLQKEVAEYEQKALHLQMNPHFVFNCLSSISSFIVQNGTDSALKYLSKFSKLMRLTLEYSKGSLIPIDKEIESLQNYLELEQLRFNHKFEFAITSSPNVEFNMGLPPLLIQPFVENAILHGMVPKQGNGKITVNFDVQNAQFVCTISDNGIGLTESKRLKENSVAAHRSMALEITRKRLEIMEAATSKSAKIEIRELQNENKTGGTQVTLRLPIQYIQ